MNSRIAIINFKKQNYKNEVDTKDTEFGSTEYSYMTDITTLKKDDIVVVDSCYGLGLGKFVRYTESIPMREKANKWIIQRVDTEAHEKRIERMEKQTTIINEMRKLKDTALELEIFSKLAESNPLMKDLLDKYNSLG